MKYLVKVYSNTCGPCKVLEKNIQTLGMDYLNSVGVKYKGVDILGPQGEEIISDFNIRTVPTLLLIDNEGNEIKRHTGLLNVEQLKEFINEAS